MRCSIISPEGRDDFQNITSIYLVTTSGERELLEGHIALIAILQEGPSLRLCLENQMVRITISPGSFFQFTHDNAEVVTAHYSIEWCALQ